MEKVTRASVLEPEVRSALSKMDLSLSYCEGVRLRVRGELDSGQLDELGSSDIHDQISIL